MIKNQRYLSNFVRGKGVKKSLLLGKIDSPHISENHIKVIKEIHSQFPEAIYAGSFGLVINGLIQRDVGDLDVIIDGGMFDFFPEKEVSSDPSMVEWKGKKGIPTYCYKFDKIKVDAMFMQLNELPLYSEHRLDEDTIIRISDPNEAIKAKLSYIKNNNSFKVFIKHLRDLLVMGIDLNDPANQLSYLNEF